MIINVVTMSMIIIINATTTLTAIVTSVEELSSDSSTPNQ